MNIYVLTLNVIYVIANTSSVQSIMHIILIVLFAFHFRSFCKFNYSEGLFVYIANSIVIVTLIIYSQKFQNSNEGPMNSIHCTFCFMNDDTRRSKNFKYFEDKLLDKILARKCARKHFLLSSHSASAIPKKIVTTNNISPKNYNTICSKI